MGILVRVDVGFGRGVAVKKVRKEVGSGNWD